VTFDIEEDDLSFSIQLPEIEDDKGLLKRIEVISDMGNSTWLNGTGIQST